jgi:hypothetical protein
MAVPSLAKIAPSSGYVILKCEGIARVYQMQSYRARGHIRCSLPSLSWHLSSVSLLLRQFRSSKTLERKHTWAFDSPSLYGSWTRLDLRTWTEYYEPSSHNRSANRFLHQQLHGPVPLRLALPSSRDHAHTPLRLLLTMKLLNIHVLPL